MKIQKSVTYNGCSITGVCCYVQKHVIDALEAFSQFLANGVGKVQNILFIIVWEFLTYQGFSYLSEVRARCLFNLGKSFEPSKFGKLDSN